MGLFDFFKSSKPECSHTQQPTWDPNTMTMQQPSSPPAPVADRTVSEEQPNTQDKVQLRGGGAGDCCCGMCAGILCFECCEECC